MILLTYLLTFLLFIGPVVLAVIGWPVEGDMFKDVHYYPAFYILVVSFLYAYSKNLIDKDTNRYAIMILGVVFIWYLGNRVLGRDVNRMLLYNSMALPALYFIFFQGLDDDVVKHNVKRIILIMFTFNGLMAVYERFTLDTTFPFNIIRTENDFADVYEETVFRSSALLGHPLTNALIMSIVMVFVLISDMGLLKKFSLYALGMFSLFCFNSRAAIMISALVLGLYLLHPLFEGNVSKKTKFISVALLMVAMAAGAYLLIAGFAGRFEAQGDFSTDGSAMARLNVWDIFLENDLRMFLWGMSGQDAEDLAYAVMGMIHIENWFILSSMIGGLVLTVIMVVLFVPLFKSSLIGYSRFVSFLILLIVVGLSSTNNSLACGVPALATFFVCSKVFTEFHEEQVEQENVSEISVD